MHMGWRGENILWTAFSARTRSSCVLLEAFFKKLSFNAQHCGVRRNPASAQTLMVCTGTEVEHSLEITFLLGWPQPGPVDTAFLLWGDHIVLNQKRPIQTCEWDPAG